MYAYSTISWNYNFYEERIEKVSLHLDLFFSRMIKKIPSFIRVLVRDEGCVFRRKELVIIGTRGRSEA